MISETKKWEVDMSEGMFHVTTSSDEVTVSMMNQDGVTMTCHFAPDDAQTIARAILEQQPKKKWWQR